MAEFEDNGGLLWRNRISWQVKITIGDAKRLRDAGLDLFDTNSVDRLKDPLDSYEILYRLIEDQAKDECVAPKRFAKRFSGSAQAAMAALFNAIIDFFPEPDKKQRPESANAPEQSNPWRNIYRIAGVLKLDPSPFTYRELLDMHRGHCEDTWQHTAEIEYIIAEVNRNPKVRSRPYSPSYFNPYAKNRGGSSGGEPLTVENLMLLQKAIRARNSR